jgi:hypothetical protein
MNVSEKRLAMPSAKPSSARAKLHAAVWLPLLATLWVTFALAVAARSHAPPATEAATPASVPLDLATDDDPDDLRMRCAGCGRVQSIRRIEAKGTRPLSFEFKVRLHGGAIHTSTSASAGPWRAGDRIILIGG